MTKATTATELRAKVISWLLAAMLICGGAFTLRVLPKPAPGVPAAQARAHTGQPRRDARKSARLLPPQYARMMEESSEVLVKNELRGRLRRFEAMAREVFDQENQLLDRVEARPVPDGRSPAINDTLGARGMAPDALSALPENATVKALYERIAAHEAAIQENHLGVAAAHKALKEGLSFPDTFRSMQLAATRMPSYPELATAVNSRHRIEGDAMELQSIDDINRYRELLGQTTRQSGLAEARLSGMTGRGRNPPPGLAGAEYGGGDPGNGGESAAGAPGASGLPYVPHQAKFENEEMVAAQALPGRRFSRQSPRKGWLYVNTWYMIGPWDTFGRGDFSITHPPEQGVDLDAIYHDGQTGTGIAENESHPLRVDGEEIELDGSLRWKFMQSESMHNPPPVTTGNSTYYAYTEIYFDEPVSMMVAIGTDDTGKFWINNREIWHDEGASWYHIDEHIEAFTFEQGWNRILIRFENNGGAATGFSFLICPKDAALRSGAR